MPTLEVATTQSDPLSKRWNMPFWSSTCHSDSKEYFLLFTSKGFKINELHNWEYEIFEILLWLKPSWNHGVSMVLQKAEAETNGMRQCPHVARPLAPLRSIETCVWHYCELVPQPTCSANYKTASNLSVVTILLCCPFFLCGIYFVVCFPRVIMPTPSSLLWSLNC